MSVGAAAKPLPRVPVAPVTCAFCGRLLRLVDALAVAPWRVAVCGCGGGRKGGAA